MVTGKAKYVPLTSEKKSLILSEVKNKGSK